MFNFLVKKVRPAVEYITDIYFLIADIIYFEGIVYSNVEDVDWVKELDYTIGEEVGEIIKQTDIAISFGNGASKKLPVGTKIYDADTQIYIAIVDDKEIRYLQMLEG